MACSLAQCPPFNSLLINRIFFSVSAVRHIHHPCQIPATNASATAHPMFSFRGTTSPITTQTRQPCHPSALHPLQPCPASNCSTTFLVKEISGQLIPCGLGMVGKQELWMKLAKHTIHTRSAGSPRTSYSTFGLT